MNWLYEYCPEFILEQDGMNTPYQLQKPFLLDDHYRKCKVLLIQIGSRLDMAEFSASKTGRIISDQAVFSLLRESKLNLSLIKSSVTSNQSCLAVKNNGDGYTLLHVAARRGVLSLVRLMVEAGSFLDAQALYGETPFLVACHVSDRILSYKLH